MIRLDAATVLLQWSVGGLFFLWFTTRRREVGLGYGWLLRGTYLLMALGGFAAGVAFGFVPVRDIAALAVAIAASRASTKFMPPSGTVGIWPLRNLRTSLKRPS